MSKRILILGAGGRVGRKVAQAALAGGHAVSILLRTPAKLPDDVRASASVHQADIAVIAKAELTGLMQGHDVIINCAGNVNDGPAFIRLVDYVAAAAEAVSPADNLVCWFFAGAGILDLNDSGRKAIDLPLIPGKYRGHLQNYRRLRNSALDWRLLCPGPMVHEPAVGLARLRLSVDKFPVAFPDWTAAAPAALSLPFFAMALPQITVPYADAAAVILAHVEPGDRMSRHRVGLALPVGMTLKWTT